MCHGLNPPPDYPSQGPSDEPLTQGFALLDLAFKGRRFVGKPISCENATLDL